MMLKKWVKYPWTVTGRLMAGALLMSATFSAAQADYSAHPEVGDFVSEMVKSHDFDRQQLMNWMAATKKQQKILDAIARPAEKTKPWKEYRQIFVTPERTSKGVEFWQANADALKRAEKEYGVPAEIIVAIIGVETRYGRHTGGYRVMDALSTLAFDYPPRSEFFRKELTNFLLLAREQKQDPMQLMGSYAGAMGYGQFMPSSYRHYAVDFDGDGFTDIWNNPVDAIGSVANYFRKHGWQPGQPVVSRARLGDTYDADLPNQSLKPGRTVSQLKAAGFSPLDNFPETEPALVIRLEGEMGAEFWMGLTNFYAITRYNHSRLYAMSVYQLSQAIAREKASL